MAEALGYVIQSDTFVDRVTANSIGIAYPAIAESRLGAFHIALPPTEAEQHQLVKHIKVETQAFVNAVNRAQYEIKLIQKYRTCLITDVVTGKIDVQHIRLEAVEPSPADLEPLDNGEVIADELPEAEDLEAVEEVAE